jgi:RNA polymerase sigma-70 factor (ECF subfamily)
MAQQPDESFILELTACQRRLYAYAFSLLGNHDQAQDVVQETNVVLWRRAGEFTPGTNFIAFAFRIAHFQTLSLRQRVHREKLLFDDQLLAEIAERIQQDVDDEERQRTLEKCIEKLNPQHRDLLHLRYSEGNSVEAVAEKLNKTIGSVAMVLHRIRMSLIRCVHRSLAKGGA